MSINFYGAPLRGRRLNLLAEKIIEKPKDKEITTSNESVQTDKEPGNQPLPDKLSSLLNKYQESGCTVEEVTAILKELNVAYTVENNVVKFSYNNQNYTLTCQKAENTKNSSSAANNITSQDLQDLYTTYLTAGCGGKNRVLVKYVTMNLANGVTPEQAAKEMIENYLKEHNITNITADEIMALFSKIDNRMESVHSWAGREGHYTESMLSDMNEIVKSFCTVEAGIKSLTDENWADLVKIYDANNADEDKRFDAIQNYLESIDSELLPGDIMKNLQVKSLEQIKQKIDYNINKTFNLFSK